jgi:hypothetical protein
MRVWGVLGELRHMPAVVPVMLYAALSARSAAFATHSISSSNSFSDSVMVMLGGCLSLTIRCLRIESLRSEKLSEILITFLASI